MGGKPDGSAETTGATFLSSSSHVLLSLYPQTDLLAHGGRGNVLHLQDQAMGKGDCPYSCTSMFWNLLHTASAAGSTDESNGMLNPLWGHEASQLRGQGQHLSRSVTSMEPSSNE